MRIYVLGEGGTIMAKSDAYKCPKCRGEMKSGTTAGDFRILKQGDLMGDRANVLYCQDCGFVELYKEPSTKERRGMLVRPAEPESQQTPTKKEPQQLEREEPARKPEKRLVR